VKKSAYNTCIDIKQLSFNQIAIFMQYLQSLEQILYNKASDDNLRFYTESCAILKLHVVGTI
jgi:hypothetical protein